MFVWNSLHNLWHCETFAGGKPEHKESGWKGQAYFSGTWLPLVPSLEAKSHQKKKLEQCLSKGQQFLVVLTTYLPVNKNSCHSFPSYKLLRNTRNLRKILSHLSDLGQMLKSSLPPKSRLLFISLPCSFPWPSGTLPLPVLLPVLGLLCGASEGLILQTHRP